MGVWLGIVIELLLQCTWAVTGAAYNRLKVTLESVLAVMVHGYEDGLEPEQRSLPLYIPASDWAQFVG